MIDLKKIWKKTRTTFLNPQLELGAKKRGGGKKEKESNMRRKPSGCLRCEKKRGRTLSVGNSGLHLCNHGLEDLMCRLCRALQAGPEDWPHHLWALERHDGLRRR